MEEIFESSEEAIGYYDLISAQDADLDPNHNDNYKECLSIDENGRYESIAKTYF